jgi:hypothetical protein
VAGREWMCIPNCTEDEMSSAPSIKVHNVTSREAAEPLVRLLEGKTFMNLEVGLAPAGGSFDVWVTTRRPDTTEEELREMVMSVMASCILDMGSAPVLRALAEGCDRLSDGDPDDRRTADGVDGRVLGHLGLLRRGTGHEPKEEASSGYVMGPDRPRWAWVHSSGQWVYAGSKNCHPVPEGTVLYADEACTVELRTV